MSRCEDVMFGEPFFFGVCDANVSGELDDFAVDGHPGVHKNFEELQQYCVRDILTYGGKIAIMRCEPVLVVDEDYARAFGQLTGMSTDDEGWVDDEASGVANAE